MSERQTVITHTAAAHVLYEYGEIGLVPGSFTQSLIRTIAKADPANRARLELGFPEYVAAVNTITQRLDGVKILEDIIRTAHTDVSENNEGENS